MPRVSSVISMFHPFHTYTCYPLTLTAKESVHAEIKSCKNVHYNNIHGKTYFPGIGRTYHLWNLSPKSKPTFSDTFNIECKFSLSQTKG